MNKTKLSLEYLIETIWRYNETAIQKIQYDTNISLKEITKQLQDIDQDFINLETMSMTDKGKQYLQYIKFSQLIHCTINAGMLRHEIERLGKKNFSCKDIKKLLKASKDTIVKNCPNKSVKVLYKSIFGDK